MTETARQQIYNAIGDSRVEGKESTTELTDAILSALPSIVRGMRREIAEEVLDAANVYTCDTYGMAFLSHPVDRGRILKAMGMRG